MTCTFFGHRDASEKVVFALKEVIESLIKKGIKKVPSINFSTYQLGGNEWTFTGKETGLFNFKRIVVFQMI